MLVVTGTFLLTGSGQAQDFRRKQADREVENLLEEKANNAGWKIDAGGLEGDERSRYHDPHDPDEPPQPPDDPVANRLMHRVDGKRGPREWDNAGDPSAIETDAWRDFLPLNESGEVILDLKNTVRLALLHSRDYQREREDLYLAALDVTEERYRFDKKFSLTNRSNRGYNGRAATARGENNFTSDSNFEMRDQMATGADVVVGLANSILWDISNSASPGTVLSSVVNFGVVQPLLRFGARNLVLENLTDSERSLLADVRRMKQFQQSFYIDVVSGRSVAQGPLRGGGGVGDAPFVAGSPSNSVGVSGFLGLLQDRQQIRNQESSVAALRDSLAQLQAAFDAGRISNRLQVDQARQALYNGQSSLLTRKAGFESSVDAYKVSLGLPPDLEVYIEDQLLERFNLVDPAVSALQNDVASILENLRHREKIATPEDLVAELQAIDDLQPRIDSQFERARNDLKRFRDAVPKRRAQMDLLKSRPELKDVHMDPELFDQSGLEDAIDRLDTNLEALELNVRETIGNLKVLARVAPPPDQLERGRSNVVAETAVLSSHLLELSLIQAAARLESIVLRPVDVDYSTAHDLADANRLDWMNARAGLVDAWRQVDIDQELLEAGLELIVNGNVPTVGNSATNFDRDSGRLQVGLAWDTPLDRLQERNRYRETIIRYQRARRGYMQFEDQISRSLRNTLRIVRLNQLNFEVRRAAVRVAIAQVDLARLRLNQPPQPGQGGAQFGATTARDLVSALGDLLNAQNDFLNVWVGFEVLRMLLDYELGTMQLNEEGLWNDPGDMTRESLKARAASGRPRAPQPESSPEEATKKLPIAEISSPKRRYNRNSSSNDSKNLGQRIFGIFKRKNR